MKRFWSILKYFGLVCATITTLYGVYKGADALIQVVAKQDTIIKSIDDLSVRVVEIKSEMVGLQTDIQAVNENTVLIGNYVEGVNKAFSEHLKRSPEVTKEDYANLMFLIDQTKKNFEPIAWQMP